MTVKEPYFNLLNQGLKTIELRLFDEKRKKINPGDEIEFSCVENPKKMFKVKVVGLYMSDTFENLCKLFEPIQAGFLTESQLLDTLDEIYPLEKQKQYNVLGIKVKVNE